MEPCFTSHLVLNIDSNSISIILAISCEIMQKFTKIYTQNDNDNENCHSRKSHFTQVKKTKILILDPLSLIFKFSFFELKCIKNTYYKHVNVELLKYFYECRLYRRSLWGTIIPILNNKPICICIF